MFISDVVVRELAETPDEARRKEMLTALRQYSPVEISSSKEVLMLAEKYVQEGIIPLRYIDDAQHIAVAVVENLDVVVSWNMSHIVRLRTRVGVNAINKLQGYKEIELCTPEEVIGDEED